MSKLVQKSEIHFSVISPSDKREQEAIKEAERKAELARAEAKRKAAQKAAEARKKAKEAAELAAKNKVQSIKRKKFTYALIGVFATIAIIVLCKKIWFFFTANDNLYGGDGWLFGVLIIGVVLFIAIPTIWAIVYNLIEKIK